MKKITSIEFVNYKAFYGEGEQNKITIPEGKNLLIYGENGSGKTSIFEGLKQFLTASSRTAFNPLSRHILVSPTYSQESEDGTLTEVPSNVAVKLNFWDIPTDTYEEKVYSSTVNTVENTDYISKANRLNSFLSYRELLKTYLMDDLHDKAEFSRKFGTLIVESILAKQINSATNKTYIETWNFFKTPRLRYKEIEMQKFARGMKYDILRINSIINEIIKYFDENIYVELMLDGPRIEYFFLPEKNREGLHPICNIDLKVTMSGISIENDEENHLTVLNEARLSALAISIYFASLINTTQKDFDYKLLFLDDIFIGLDTSNRLPLLKIINEFRKPKIEQQVDDESGEIVEIIKKENGNVVYDDELFFNNYQVFISTYDKYWSEVAKQFLQDQNKLNWHYIELYTDTITHNNFAVPSIIPCSSKITKAEQYLHKHDYRACATYLRAMCEKELDRILPHSFTQFVKVDEATGNYVPKPGNLNDKIIGFEQFCYDETIDFEPFKYLRLYKNHLLNKLSHNDISSPIYKKELIDTLGSIKALAKISKKNIPDKIKDIGLVLRNIDGKEVSVRIKKIETQNFIFVNTVPRLSAKCKCEIEGVAIDGSVVAPTKTEFDSLYDLYTHVCDEYNIEKVHILHEVFHKRVRDAALPRKSLIELIEV